MYSHAPSFTAWTITAFCSSSAEPEMVKLGHLWFWRPAGRSSVAGPIGIGRIRPATVIATPIRWLRARPLSNHSFDLGRADHTASWMSRAAWYPHRAGSWRPQRSTAGNHG